MKEWKLKRNAGGEWMLPTCFTCTTCSNAKPVLSCVSVQILLKIRGNKPTVSANRELEHWGTIWVRWITYGVQRTCADYLPVPFKSTAIPRRLNMLNPCDVSLPASWFKLKSVIKTKQRLVIWFVCIELTECVLWQQSVGEEAVKNLILVMNHHGTDDNCFQSVRY